MKTLLATTVAAAFLGSAVQAAVIARLQEGENDSVLFSIEVTNPSNFDYSGFDATHLEYIFFNDVGDFVNGSALGSNNPEIFQPVSHGLVGTSFDGFTIGIQAIALDNDDTNPNDPDDFVIRFLGQTAGLTRTVTPLNFETMVNYDPVRIRNLSFSVLNEGIFTSNSAPAQALGGFTLEVNALAPVPLPLAGWSLLAGFGFLAGMARRKRRLQGTAA